MIRWYHFQNFYSFRESTTISFELSGKGPLNDLSVESVCGARLSRIAAVLGPNASGKTQLLKPLCFLSWLTCHSFASPVDEPIPFEQHFFADEEELTELEIEFEAEGRLFRYEVKLNQQCIVEESLKERGARSFKTLFRRQRNGTSPSDGEEFMLRGIDFPLSQARKVRGNVTLIAWAYQHGNSLAGVIHEALGGISGNIAMHGKAGRSEDDLYRAAKFYNDNEPLFARAKAILTRLDLGISGLELVSMDVEDQGKVDKVMVPFAHHQDSQGRSVRRPLFLESAGTGAVYQLLSVLLPVLEYGGVVVIDELESDLHPMMIDPILSLFLDRETNPHDAQMLFSCHLPAVFERLEKEQVFLVEKDKDLCSTAWRLDSIKGVRRDDNLRAKYYSGAYGAIPWL